MEQENQVKEAASGLPGVVGQSEHVVKAGQTVVLEVNGEKQAFLNITKNGRVKIGKHYCSPEPLIGKPYGSLFSGGDRGDLEEIQREALEDWDDVAEVAQDNRNLVDNDANQKLSADDIAEMRASGMSGEAIMAALEANSATFAGKTQFSQAKYRKRKMKKYTVQATVHRPTARSIAEVYFSKSPNKIHHLRVDTLAIMMSLANVGAYSNVLVMESCSGLVTAAAVERLGGFGHVCSTYPGTKPPPLGAVGLLNISEQMKDSMSSAPLPTLLAYLEQPRADSAATSAAAGEAALPAGANGVLHAAASGPQANASQQVNAGASGQAPAQGAGAASQPDAMQPAGEQATAVAGPPAGADSSAGAQHVTKRARIAPDAEPNGAAGETANAAGSSLASDGLTPQAGPPEAVATARGANSGPGDADADMQDAGVEQGADASLEHEGPRKHRRVSNASLQRYCRRGFTSCLVAAPSVHPVEAMRKLLPLLAPSASFAIYSPWSAPLAECMNTLQQAKQAVALQLQESWWREYQVLPSRTHPTMSTSGTGGYILSGICVVP